MPRVAAVHADEPRDDADDEAVDDRPFRVLGDDVVGRHEQGAEPEPPERRCSDRAPVKAVVR
jgi:hypothetical protein